MYRKTLCLLFISAFFTLNAQVNKEDEAINLQYILKQLKLDRSKCKMDLVALKAIPNNPDETIVVIPEIVEEEEYYFELNSHILIVDSKTGKIKYNYFESSNTNNWVSDAIQLTSIAIDTAPYQISEQNRAFGIIVRYVGSSRANPYESETIALFTKSGDTLKKILNNYEIMYNGGEWDTDCVGEFVMHKKTLIISTNKTNDYFDIIVKNKIITTKNYIDVNGECNAKEKSSTEKSLFKFNVIDYKS